MRTSALENLFEDEGENQCSRKTLRVRVIPSLGVFLSVPGTGRWPPGDYEMKSLLCDGHISTCGRQRALSDGEA